MIKKELLGLALKRLWWILTSETNECIDELPRQSGVFAPGSLDLPGSTLGLPVGALFYIIIIMNYRLYVDDSGTKEYIPDGKYYPNKGPTPFFVFGGILHTEGAFEKLRTSFRALKLEVFGSENVEIKANWLRIQKERVSRYLDPYNLSGEQLTRFVDGVYTLIVEARPVLIAIVIDKRAMQAKYGQDAHYTSSIAYEILLQRCQYEMEERNGEAFVTIDDMRGATPKGNEYRDNLIRQHRLLLWQGSQLQRGIHFSRIRGLNFKDSSIVDNLQLADLVAYSAYKQALDYGSMPARTDETDRVYEYLQRLLCVYRNKNGEVQGKGLVLFPS